MAVVTRGKGPRAEQWAKAIRRQMGKSVEAVLETGRLLMQAKADLTHGEWCRLFEAGLLPFSRSTAFRLMSIAEHNVIGNVAHVQHLPPSWGTLYALTQVPEPALKNAL
jgi:hypothetical protein